MDLGVTTCLLEHGIGSGFRDAEEDVGSDGALEEGCFLGDEGQGFAVFFAGEVGDVGAVEKDFALLDGVESRLLVLFCLGVWEMVGYRSRRETMLVFPQPEGPTKAANWPFSMVRLRPVKMGISRVGYLNYISISLAVTSNQKWL